MAIDDYFEEDSLDDYLDSGLDDVNEERVAKAHIALQAIISFLTPDEVEELLYRVQQDD